MGKVLSKKNMNCLFRFSCLLLVLYLLYTVLKPIITEGLTAGDSVYPNCSAAVNGVHDVMCGGKKVDTYPEDTTVPDSLAACNKKASDPTLGEYIFGICGIVGPKGNTGVDAVPDPFKLDCECSNPAAVPPS